jgi:hypothetical protein
MKGKYQLADLCEQVADELKPPLDRIGAEAKSEHQKHWQDEGVVILENVIPGHIIAEYSARFVRDNAARLGAGYGAGTPYMLVKEIKDLCLNIVVMDVLEELIGGPMGMHLNLTGWKSTERNWHQDDYLNPHYINAHYAGVWYALDDIHEDAGPFEYVPGSHRILDACRRDKIRAALPPEQSNTPEWPKYSETVLDDLYEAEIERNGWEVKKWCGKEGDVLIWHGWLLHRGSKPKNPELLRPTIITHYSALSHRHDMPIRDFYQNKNAQAAGHFFVL